MALRALLIHHPPVVKIHADVDARAKRNMLPLLVVIQNISLWGWHGVYRHECITLDPDMHGIILSGGVYQPNHLGDGEGDSARVP
jgi:hypothetical protein